MYINHLHRVRIYFASLKTHISCVAIVQNYYIFEYIYIYNYSIIELSQHENIYSFNLIDVFNLQNKTKYFKVSRDNWYRLKDNNTILFDMNSLIDICKKKLVLNLSKSCDSK